MLKYIFHTDLAGIPLLAKNISRQLRGGEIVGLIGALGAGKTSFAQALARELGVKQKVTSPTFVIMQQFKGFLPKTKFTSSKPVTLTHIDTYRTKNFTELEALGITEAWSNQSGITIIEWADRIKNYLPTTTWYVYFDSPANKKMALL